MSFTFLWQVKPQVFCVPAAPTGMHHFGIQMLKIQFSCKGFPFKLCINLWNVRRKKFSVSSSLFPLEVNYWHNLSSMGVDDWFIHRCQPFFCSGIERIPFCNLSSQACLIVYSETLKTSATLEIDSSQGTMVKSWIISPLSSVIASFFLISSSNRQQFKQFVLCPNVGSSSAITTALLKVFVTLSEGSCLIWHSLEHNQTAPKFYQLDHVQFQLRFHLSTFSHPSQLHFQ